MQCPMCHLPEEWHDDGECPTVGRAARYLFGSQEPDDLRELVADPNVKYNIRQLDLRVWGIVKTWTNDYGRRVNQTVKTASSRTALRKDLDDYRAMA